MNPDSPASPMLSPQVAHDLAHALEDIEKARVELVGADLEDAPAAAFRYMEVRGEATAAFEAAQREYDLANAGAATPGAPPPAPPVGETPAPPPESSPTSTEPAEPVFEVLPPPANGTVISADNIDSYGPMGFFVSKSDRDTVVEVSKFAFDAGTSVEVVDQGAKSTVGLTEPMLVQRAHPEGGAVLHLVALAGFHDSYTEIDNQLPQGEGPAAPPASGEPAPPAAPGETPGAPPPAAAN